MSSEFDENKSKQDNIKASVDKILGQQTNYKRVKKTEDDIKKNIFCRIIDGIINLEERQINLLEICNIDLTLYNNNFFNIIEDLLSLHFNKEQINVINFYIYDMHNSDGTKIGIKDKAGNVKTLESSSDLWDIVKSLK